MSTHSSEASPVALTCNSCQRPYFSMDTHKREYHNKKTTVRYDDGESCQIVRDMDSGLFVCGRCSHSERNSQQMSRHGPRCPGIQDEEGPPEDPDLPTSTSPLATAEDGTDSVSFGFDPSANVLVNPVLPPSADACEELDLTRYRRDPDETVVLRHSVFNITQLGVGILTGIPSFICLVCGYAPCPTALENHLNSHHHPIPIPEGMADALAKEYNILPMSKVRPPLGFPAPIFGLNINPRPLFFCGGCRHGYKDHHGLRSHQTGAGKCDRTYPDLSQKHFTSYGQCLTKGPYQVWFPVDVEKLTLRTADDPVLPVIFKKNFPPPLDYSKVEYTLPEGQQDLSTFAYREGFHDHVLGYSAEILADACRDTTEDDGEIHDIRRFIVGYIERVQPEIARHAAFGLQRLMGNVGLGDSLESFNRLMPNSQAAYGLHLWKLVGSLLRQVVHAETTPGFVHRRSATDKTIYVYPISDDQVKAFKSLLRGQRQGVADREMEERAHIAINRLFSHQKSNHNDDKFFSAVSCFVVLSSFTPSASLRRANILTSQIAKLVYANRATQLLEMRQLQSQDASLSIYNAYDIVKVYLRDMEETPMAYMFNVGNLLRVISADEHTDGEATFIDGSFRSLNYDGDVIHLADMPKLVETEVNAYLEILKAEIFHGEPVPPSLDLTFDIGTLHENPQNRTPGWCFMDDPRNPFIELRTVFGEFLLSDVARAEKYTYLDQDNKLIWRLAPSMDLLEAMDEANNHLVLACVFGAGPSGRSTNVASQSLRNIPACHMRNVEILFHNLCLIGIQDKTTHKRLKDRFVPHAPPAHIAQLLLYNLAVIRPFQVYLTGELLGEATSRRFYEYLHPRLRRNLCSDSLSSQMGNATESILHARLGMTKWRKITGTFLRKHFESGRDFSVTETFFFDLSNEHGTTTANARYQLDSAKVAGISPEQIMGCIQASINWQYIARIGQSSPLRLTRSGEAEAQAKALSEETWRGTPLSQPLIPQFDASAFALEVAHSLQTGLENIIDARLKSSFIISQKLYNAPKPRVYEPPELRELSSIQVHPSRLRMFREKLDDEAAFFSCPEQGLLLEVLASRQGHHLFVMKCGLGKTLIVLKAAGMDPPGVVTLVLLPHSGLHQDFERRCREEGVTQSRWAKNGKFNKDVSIISSAIESIKIDEFRTFFKDLALQGKLGRIVKDECHRLLTDWSYREIFGFFETVIEYGVQILAQTGTLAATDLPAFRELSGIADWNVVRMPVSRPNLFWEVVVCRTEAERDAAVIERVKERLEVYNKSDRLMVFCGRVQQCIDIAEKLGVEAYHARNNEKDPKINEEIFRGFYIGEPQVSVSTSLLGSGVDMKGVRDVINVGYPYTMYDLQQQADRAGRDGKRATASTFLFDGEKVPFLANGDNLDLGKQDLQSWGERSTSQCLRIIPTQYLDGRTTDCMSLGKAELCSFCTEEYSKDPPKECVPMPQARFLPPPRSSVITSVHPASAPVRPAQRPAAPPRPAASSTSRPSTLGNGTASRGQPTASTEAAPQQTPRRMQLALVTSTGSALAPAVPSRPATPPAPDQTESVSPRHRRGDDRAPAVGRFTLLFPDEVGPTIEPRARSVASSSRALPVAEDPLSTEARIMKNTIVAETVLKILTLMKDGCASCFGAGVANWRSHARNFCPVDSANDNDALWGEERGKFFEISLKGYCWNCVLPQKGIWHVAAQQNTARKGPVHPHVHLIKPCLYSFMVAPHQGSQLRINHYPYFPDGTVDINDIRDWATQPSEPWGTSGALNLHHLFVWMAVQRKLITMPAELEVDFANN